MASFDGANRRKYNVSDHAQAKGPENGQRQGSLQTAKAKPFEPSWTQFLRKETHGGEPRRRSWWQARKECLAQPTPKKEPAVLDNGERIRLESISTPQDDEIRPIKHSSDMQAGSIRLFIRLSVEDILEPHITRNVTRTAEALWDPWPVQGKLPMDNHLGIQQAALSSATVRLGKTAKHCGRIPDSEMKPSKRAKYLDSSISKGDSPQAGMNSSSRILLQPETRPITQEQLVNEVKGIYAGLVMFEKKCVEIDQQQRKTTSKLSDELWLALIAPDRSLPREHHKLFAPDADLLEQANLGDRQTWSNVADIRYKNLHRKSKVVDNVVVSYRRYTNVADAQVANAAIHSGDGVDGVHHDQTKLSKQCILDHWNQERLTYWRQLYGQGKSRTWRYRLYVKATKQQLSALVEKPRPCYLHVSWGPNSKLPITVDRISRPLTTNWKLGKRRRRGGRRRVDEHLSTSRGSYRKPYAEPESDELLKSSYYDNEVDWSWSRSGPFSGNSESPLALPYENFIGAFLAPTYRVRRFLRHEDHGEVYAVDSLSWPTGSLEAKVYDIKALSRNMYNYRVRDIKHLEKNKRYVGTIYQPGRRIVISLSEASPLGTKREDRPLSRIGSLEFELAFPPLLRTRATKSPPAVQDAIVFYRLKALRAALQSCLGGLTVYSRSRPNGSAQHCMTPVRTYLEQCKAAERMGLPVKHKSIHRMERKKLRQQAYRQKKQQRKKQPRFCE